MCVQAVSPIVPTAGIVIEDRGWVPIKGNVTHDGGIGDWWMMSEATSGNGPIPVANNGDKVVVPTPST